MHRTPSAITAASDRLSGARRLYGEPSLARFAAARVAVVGLGGVGSWAAEALVRTGVASGAGALTLMDLDDVCVTNTNRQAQATAETIGRPKADALADRLRKIVPEARTETIDAFFGRTTADRLWATGPNVVIDAIDRADAKALLIAQAVERGVAVVTVGGAGARRDPGRVLADDLARAFDDSLLAATRKRLRQLYGFSRKPRKRFGVACVFSPEPMTAGCGGDGDALAGPKRLDCVTGYGSSVVVTATFGFLAAHRALEAIEAGVCRVD